MEMQAAFVMFIIIMFTELPSQLDWYILVVYTHNVFLHSQKKRKEVADHENIEIGSLIPISVYYNFV